MLVEIANGSELLTILKYNMFFASRHATHRESPNEPSTRFMAELSTSAIQELQK